MEYLNNNKVSDLKIAYIGGGSKGWAWGLMSDLASEEQLSGTVNLYDIDYESALSNEVIGNKFSAHEASEGKWQYIAVKSLSEALTGADFVVISILPGTFVEMASDVHTPEKYGVYQSVGDTVGPGGMLRALRTIPMFVEIAEAIKKYSPEAWVINYTNPMTLCTRTLYEVFPDIKAFGCCHEVFSIQKLLVEMLDELKGIENVQREQIKINVKGINHFTWIDEAWYKGLDLMPLYDEFAKKHYEEGYSKENKEQLQKAYFLSSERVKFDLFQRYGIIAAAGDRHLAEFMPPWYLKNPETVEEWKFMLTPVSWRIENKEVLNEKSKRLVSGAEAVEINKTGEEGVKQIKALLGLGDHITNVNLPNKGQVEGLPLGAVVETNAVFRNNSIKPVISGRLPEGVEGFVMRHVLNQEMVLKAAMNKDKDLAFKAFVDQPLVNIDVNDAKKLFEEMLSNTKAYLSGWDIN